MNNFDLSFSFISSGLAIIKKKNDNELMNYEKLEERSYNFKNILRKLWKKIRKN